MTTTGLERNQNRKRQALKRQRDRVERIEGQAKSLTGDWPALWRDQFLQRVKRRQAGAAKANTEVEKTAAIMPDGLAREAYVRANYRNTKVSLTREKDEFLKRKKRA